MTTKTTLAGVAVMVIALLALGGCVSNAAKVEQVLTLEMKQILVGEARTIKHTGCIEDAERLGKSICEIDGCQMYCNAQYQEPQMTPVPQKRQYRRYEPRY